MMTSDDTLCKGCNDCKHYTYERTSKKGIQDKTNNKPYDIYSYIFYKGITKTGENRYQVNYKNKKTKTSHTIRTTNLIKALHERDLLYRYKGNMDLIVEDDSPNIYEKLWLPPFPDERTHYEKEDYRIEPNIYGRIKTNGDISYRVLITRHNKRYNKSFTNLKEAKKYKNEILKIKPLSKKLFIK